MASEKKKPKAKQPVKALLRDGPNWPLFTLAALGMILSAYLTYTAWAEKLVVILRPRQRLRCRLEQPLVDSVRHAGFFLGIYNLRPAGRGGLEPLRG